MNANTAEYRPTSDDEEFAAAAAVAQHRREQEQSDLVESLTDREKALVEQAYHQAWEDAFREMEKRLVHPAAVTLDAGRVAAEVRQFPRTPDVYKLAEHVRPFPAIHDKRIVRVVTTALRRLEAEQGATQ